MVIFSRASEIWVLTKQAFGRYKSQIVLLTVLGFVTGTLEAVGITAIIPLFSLLPGGPPVGDWISRQIAGLFSVAHLPFSFESLSIFIVLLFFLKAPALVLLNFILSKITADYESETKARLFSRTLHSSWPFLMKQKSGHLETIMLVDVPASATLLNQISGALMLVASVVVYLLAAINNSSTITFLTLAVGGAVFVFSKPLFWRSRQAASERAAISKEVAHHVSENIYGIKTLKTSLGLPGAQKRAEKYFSDLRRIDVRSNNLKNISRAFMQPLAVLFIVVLFAFSYRAGAFNWVAIGVTVFLIDRIFIYLQQLLNTLHVLNDLVPNLRAVLKHEGSARANRETADARGDAFLFKKSFEFRDVSFGYSADQPVLQNISFEVRKGEMVGIIGPSGVGKTTLVDLILRLFSPQAGTILLDGKDIAAIKLDSWRKNIGYVAQDIFLMNDSVGNNIKFYDESMTDKQIAEAARQADLYEFIQSLPEKFETIVGERGLRLSAGQRQRIVIARILARKPELLILDEATSALDNESEAQIQAVIKKLKGRVTVFAIAHRLSTVMDSDKLMVLEGGRLVEQGEPQKLMADKNSYFFRSYEISKN